MEITNSGGQCGASVSVSCRVSGMEVLFLVDFQQISCPSNCGDGYTRFTNLQEQVGGSLYRCHCQH